MKVIMHGYNTCCQNKAGGVQTRIRKIASLLEERGVEVELFNPFETDIASCDVLHVFQLDIEKFGLIRCAKQLSKKVVMSAVVPINEKGKMFLYKYLRWLPLMTTYKVMYRSLQLTDCVIVETQAEADFLHSIYSVPYSKMEVIPNGFEINSYKGNDIFETIGKKSDYILQVGRFDGNKNQLNVIRALRDTMIDVVFIGGADHTNQNYYSRCVKASDGYENIHLLGWLPKDSSVLQSAYANAKLVILPSHFETFGLVALEGGIAGANLALSNTLPILCYSSFKDCPTFNPDNIDQMRDVIVKAFSKPKDNKLKESIINEFNWDGIIDNHITIYEKNY